MTVVVTVYMRGTMYEFTPRIINELFQLSDLPYNLDLPITFIRDPIEDVVSLLSEGYFRLWEDLTPSHLSPSLALLYKICCRNWMPAMNETTICQDQATLVYMVVCSKLFNFGKLFYDQIIDCAFKPNRRLVLPNFVG